MLKIRLGKKQDLTRLAEIYSEAYNSLNIGEKWTKATALKLLEFVYQDQKDLFFVAVDKEIIGAIVASVKPWWDGNHLFEGEFFVLPKYQKHGVGTELLKHLFVSARKKYKVVSWDTFTHRIHENPLSWYKKRGFEEIKQWVMITGNVDDVLEKIKKKSLPNPSV